MEVTIWTEALWQKDRIGDSASMQAGTRSECRAGLETANAEADPPRTRGRPPTVREENDTSTELLPPGYWHWHACKMEEVATRETLSVLWHAATGTPQEAGRAARVAEWPVLLKTPGNAGRGKGPQVRKGDQRMKGFGAMA